MKHFATVLLILVTLVSCKDKGLDPGNNGLEGYGETASGSTVLSCGITDSKMTTGALENDSYPFVWNTDDTLTVRVMSPKGHPLGFPKVASKYNGQKSCSVRIDSIIAPGQNMRVFFSESHGGDYTRSYTNPFIPAEQVQAAPGAANMHDYTYAWSDEVPTTGADNYTGIWLYHAPAFVKINLTSTDYADYNVVGARLVSTTRNLTGKFSVSAWHMPFKYAKAPTITPGEGYRYAQTTIANPGKIGTGQSVWMSVLPGTYTDLKIELTLTYSGITEKLIIPGPASVELKGNTVNELNLQPLTYRPILVMMYDDNTANDGNLISMCNARGIKVTLASIGHIDKSNAAWSATAANLQAWKANGHGTIGHGVVKGITVASGHTGLDTMTDDEALRAIQGNNKALNDFSLSHAGIAYFNTWVYNERTLRIVKQNYDFGFLFGKSAYPFTITPDTDPFYYNRYVTDNSGFLTKAKNNIDQMSGNSILAYGGHMNRTGTGTGSYSTMAEFTEFLDYVSAKIASGQILSLNVDDAINIMRRRVGYKYIPTTGISLDKASVTLTTGQSIVLNQTLAPETCTDKKVSWTSSNTAVASVYFGDVTAVGTGTATITVTSHNGSFTATCTVTVK